MKNKLKINQKSEKEVVVKVEMSVFDKLNVLDDYYHWLFNTCLDANNASVLNEYKRLLIEEYKRP